MDLKKMKNKKGITLIALAVTIVVLLILAGVTISSVFSENGIINKALQAQNAIDKAQANDLAELTNLTSEIEKYTSNNDVVGADLSQYATLSFQSYVMKKAKQKCEYMQMYVEISDVQNQTDKITYAVGTNWQENIVKENDQTNKLFLKNNSKLEMIRNLEKDTEYGDYYDPDSDDDAPPVGKKLSKNILDNKFTDVKISNLYVKKGKNYNIKIKIKKTAAVDRNYNTVINDMYCIYEGETGIITDNTSLEIDKTTISKKISLLFDIDMDTGLSADDANILESMIRSYNKDDIPVYYAINDSSTEVERVLLLINNEGVCVNETAEKYLGFDYDRNGYIDKVDANIIMGHLVGNKI